MGYTPEEAEAAFESRISRTAACWLWQGGRNNSGYGSFRGQGVHRYAYEKWVGPIAPRMTIDHLCKVKLCINPTHLEAVSLRENILRGRGWVWHHVQATHCPQGHPYDAENTNHRRGRRYCRACERARDRGRRDATYWRDYRAKRKAEGRPLP